MKKTITIQCDKEIKQLIVTALGNYIDVAFPPHSSDCALVARDALQQAVKALREDFANQDRADYNKRLRAMFKEGIKLHYQLQEADTGRSHQTECDLLLEVIGGTQHDDDELARARAADSVD